MLVSYLWIKQLLPGLHATAAEVASRLTRGGLEVEAVQEVGLGLDPIVVAEVRAIEPHPSKSGLRLVTVDRGGQTQCVVCGASNVPAPGGRVLLAPLGTVIPGLGPLTPREIGGVSSEGMLVSEEELGLATESDGIIVLDSGLGAPGSKLFDVLPEARDTIFHIGVTPNRPDALGHVGVARDVAALFGIEFAPPAPGAVARWSDERLDALVTVENHDFERCPHYGAAVVLDVSIAPSPVWLRWRLHKLGVRPISNVVDITNFVLLGFGQPMHAFDLDRVRGGRIGVRRARAGEPFTTLDGVARSLDADDLVICDAEGPSALAGVMGGQDSEIRDSTRRVLLECAYFTPRGVRRTSRRHGLGTESSFRFERGVDFGAVPRVLEIATALICELGGGAAVKGAIHAKGPEPELPVVPLRSQRLNALLGVEVPFAEATGILRRLGLEVVRDGSTEVEVRGASHRPDISREADLIEEVARVRGLDLIPSKIPAIQPQPPRTSGKLEREAATHATALGLSEALTYSFVSPRELEAVHAPPPLVRIKNPLNEARTVMRTSLLPGLLEALGRARRHGEAAVRLFAVGSRFLPAADETRSVARPRRPEDARDLPGERPSFAAVLAGPRPTYLAAPEPVDVFDAKGIALEMVERMTHRTARARLASGGEGPRHLHPRGAGEVWVDDQRVGVFGPLHPEVVDAFDLGGEAFVVELDLAAIEGLGRRTPRHRAIPRLPPVTRDVAMVVHDDVTAEQVEAVIREAAGELCESVTLFDVFRSGSIPDDHRSLAFHLVYRDPKAASEPDRARMLTDREVDQRHAQVLAAAGQRLGGQLRA
ncbi:MAG: phenylalanine--tRNA ligase subunit beta [Myxococcales bacterium]|nr:phenylalanine--tRNA ligase subunit beta [Myxococcales bacterium]